jgi:hypothetical protein
MKVIIDSEEYYPFYYFKDFSDDPTVYDVILDLPKEKVKKFQRIFREFTAMQDELETLCSIGSRKRFTTKHRR